MNEEADAVWIFIGAEIDIVRLHAVEDECVVVEKFFREGKLSAVEEGSGGCGD